MDILDYVLRGMWRSWSRIGGYLHRLIIVLGVLTKLFLNRGVSSLSGIARYWKYNINCAEVFRSIWHWLVSHPEEMKFVLSLIKSDLPGAIHITPAVALHVAIIYDVAACKYSLLSKLSKCLASTWVYVWKWSSLNCASVQNPVQISVHGPVQSPVHESSPVQSPGFTPTLTTLIRLTLECSAKLSFNVASIDNV